MSLNKVNKQTGETSIVAGLGGLSGSHTIENSSGIALPQRTNLQFGSGLGVTDDAVNDATVVELTGESVHANMFVKLWENPNPTSAFVAQNITLLSDDYDFLLVLWKNYYTGTLRTLSTIASKGTGIFLFYTNAQSNGMLTAKRYIDWVSDTQFSVADAEKEQGSATSVTIDNSFNIPLVIYGFKKDVDISSVIASVSTEASKCMMSDGVTNVEDAVKSSSPKTDIATVESGSTASRAYSVGELVYVNGNLYKVITAISLGSAFTVGTNIQSTSVSGVLESPNNLDSGITVTLGADYTVSSDGYLQMYINNSVDMNVRIYGANKNNSIRYNVKNTTGTSQSYSLFVKKGMIIRCDNTTAQVTLTFHALT